MTNVLNAVPEDLLAQVETLIRGGEVVYIGLDSDWMSARLQLAARDPVTGEFSGQRIRVLPEAGARAFAHLADVAGACGDRLIRLTRLMPQNTRGMSSDALIDLGAIKGVRTDAPGSRMAGGSGVILLDGGGEAYADLRGFDRDTAAEALDVILQAAAGQQKNPDLLMGLRVEWTYADEAMVARALALAHLLGSPTIDRGYLKQFVTEQLRSKAAQGLYYVRGEVELPYIMHQPLRFALLTGKAGPVDDGTIRRPYRVRVTVDPTEHLTKPIPANTGDPLQTDFAARLNTATF